MLCRVASQVARVVTSSFVYLFYLVQENVVLTGCSRDGIFVSDHTLNQ